MARRPVIRWTPPSRANPIKIGATAGPKRNKDGSLRKKPGTPERNYQMLAVQWLELQFPHWIIAAAVNEAAPRSKNPDAQARFHDSRRKAGVKKGFPDLTCVMPEGRVLYIEMKSDVGTLSEDQEALHHKLRGLGHTVIIGRKLETIQVEFRRLGLMRGHNGGPT